MFSKAKAVELWACAPRWPGLVATSGSPAPARTAQADPALPSSGQCLWAQCLCQQEMPMSRGPLVSFPFGQTVDHGQRNISFGFWAGQPSGRRGAW